MRLKMQFSNSTSNLEKKIQEFLEPGTPPGDYAKSLADAIKKKEVDFLIDVLGHPKGFNDKSKLAFSDITGVRFGRTRKSIVEAIYKWAGFSPKEVQQREDMKKAKNETQRKKMVLKWARQEAEAERVNFNGKSMTVRQFVDNAIKDGFSSLEKLRGRYYLIDRTGEKGGFKLTPTMRKYAQALYA